MAEETMGKEELKKELREYVVELKVAYKAITAKPAFLTEKEKIELAAHALAVAAYGLDRMIERL